MFWMTIAATKQLLSRHFSIYWADVRKTETNWLVSKDFRGQHLMVSWTIGLHSIFYNLCTWSCMV